MQRNYYFQRLGSAEGLAQNTVSVIHQDSRGFIWIGTEGGLHRYDGYRLTRFQHDPSRADSLPDNLISAVLDAGAGQLWVATLTGSLVRFDPASNRVTARTAFGGSRPGTADARITALSKDHKEQIWVGSGHGISVLDPEGAHARDVWQFSAAPVQPMPLIRGFAQCPDSRLYAATSEGLVQVNTDTARARVLRLQPNLEIRSALCTRSGEVLVGTDTGLWRIGNDGVTARAVWHISDADDHTPVTALAQDDRRGVWIGVRHLGLGYLNQKNGIRRLIKPRPDLPHSLPETVFTTLMVDRSGLLWIGGDTRGVSYTQGDGTPFSYIVDTAPSAQVTGGNNIRALFEDSRHRLWLSNEAGGLKIYDTKARSFEHFGSTLALSLHLDTQAELRIYDITGDGRDGLWLASSHGALHFDPDSGAASSLHILDPHDKNRDHTLVRSILRARDGSLWLGIPQMGLLHVSADLKTRRLFRADPRDPLNSLANALVLALGEDAEGRIWAGTINGLSMIDPASGRVRSFFENPDQVDSLSGRVVTDIYQAPAGDLWIGTHTGLDRLLRIDAAGAHFQRFLRRDGLPDQTIYCILADHQGKLWLSSNLGIARYDPTRRTAREFGLQQGLQGLEFNNGACLARRDGSLVFGGVSGLNTTRPKALELSGYQPPVVITSVRIGQQSPISVSPDQRKLDMQQGQRVVQFEFASLDFAASTSNRFRYRLEGFNRGWIDAGTRNQASYTNLDAEHYVFQVMGSNRDGIFSNQIAQIGLTVTPPWWTSLPMKLLLASVLLVVAIAALLSSKRKRRAALRHREELMERDTRLRLALWGSSDEFWDWNLHSGMVHRVGPGELAGGHREQKLSVQDWRDYVIHPDDLPRLDAAVADHLDGRTDHMEAEHRIADANGQWMWVRTRGKIAERDSEGEPLRLCGTSHDITRSLLVERERRIAAEVIRSMTEAVTVTDLSFRFRSINPAFTRMTGYGEDEVLGRDARMLNCSQESVETYLEVRRTLERVGHWRGELWQARKGGEEFLCWVELSEVCDASGARTHYVAVLSDITDRKRAEQELLYLANYDTLTGLPNRAMLSERLGQAIAHARRAGRKVAVLFLDLDRFKHVNDSLGHAVGDRMLRAAGERLRGSVRDKDIVARLGGDEFTVVLEDLADADEAEQMAQRLIEAFSKPLELESRQEVLISPSIGIALFPDHAQLPPDLLKFADTAMYQAKDRGRNTWMVYVETMDAVARRRATMMSSLRRALERREFHLLFQPKMSLRQGQITGTEALLRWDSRELGEVLPSSFIPLAEETGLIVEIGEYVLAEACATLQRFHQQGFPELSMAINLSVAQLLSSELVPRLKSTLDRYGIQPQQIELELTESVVMANAMQSVRTLGELKAIGVRLAIDDFGTGYSSLAYLKRLPIDTLKIDKEFVGDITTDPDDEAITTTVIRMAHSLELKVIAEGVESAEQLAHLRQHDCDEIQGHWLSEPLAADACLEFLRQRVDRPQTTHL